MMPSFKNTASILPEISFIHYFPHFTCSCIQCDVITDLICIIEKCQLNLTRKKIFQKDNTIFLYLERPFKEAQNFFLFHRHFKN